MGNGNCYLPDCVVTVGNTPITDSQFGGPGGSFGDFGGSGGFPLAFPKPVKPFLPPKPRAINPLPHSGGPALSPSIRPKPAAGPALLPGGGGIAAIGMGASFLPYFEAAATPTETVLGSLIEQAISETGSLEAAIQETILQRSTAIIEGAIQATEEAAAAAAEAAGAAAPTVLGRVLAAIAPAGAMLTYSEALGPSAAEEAANVAAQLVPATGGAAYTPPESPVAVRELYGLPVGGPPAIPVLPQVDVNAFRAPAPVPAPLPLQLLNPDFGVGPLPLVATTTLTMPQPQPRPRPQPQPLREPQLQPRPLTLPQLSLRVRPKPRLAGSPSPNPALDTRGQTGTRASPQDCGGQGKKKDKSKKRKPRNVCYRGVYEERRNGLIKFKRERITCR